MSKKKVVPRNHFLPVGYFYTQRQMVKGAKLPRSEFEVWSDDPRLGKKVYFLANHTGTQTSPDRLELESFITKNRLRFEWIELKTTVTEFYREEDDEDDGRRD